MDPSPDTAASRITVLFVGLFGLLTLIGVFALLWVGKDAATVAIFSTLGAGAIGGMVNMATTRSNKAPQASEPPPVDLDGPDPAVGH